MNIILDACAIIAFLRNEAGADVVRETLLNEDNTCMIHAINLCEVYDDFYRDIGEAKTEQMIQDLTDINIITRSDLDDEFWRTVGRYKATIRRISLADCFALALANKEAGILLTSDRKEFEPVIFLNICPITFIR
ncbi:type II toxin-antitoxin system VapC family toxin [Planktothrix mougeotii]|uniref:Type II toxin-antitoxin system VapC family toxin n=1 Tax=Planktothrix mougeotii LEGE 06226 TaxID=1828728 RepID=A0ABR9UB01_9CYAN|nr:type II toxin-antitoxin system VapC family toxin [Planktothrix mougeotii]MBE9143299.1 type II toxin-antitoxin system VapC family toxin [Planktothrix mougeotii LEGE 06226]